MSSHPSDEQDVTMEYERKSSLGSLPDKVADAQVSSSTAPATGSAVASFSSSSSNIEPTTTTLIAKFGKQVITLRGLCPESTTIGGVKEMLQEHTKVLPKRQKLIGLKAEGTSKVHDDLLLKQLKAKKGTTPKTNGGNQNNTMPDDAIVHSFILMGTPEEHIFVDPSDVDDLPDVIDDFDLDFNAGSDEWFNHVATGVTLKRFTEKTEIFLMNPLRQGKPLLVLDLDHTLLDFSSKSLQRDVSTHVVGQGMAARMKRPYMDEFLAHCYTEFDLAVWSQTSWRWLETKLTELGMLTNPHYKFCFVLDKTSMFSIKSTRRKDGRAVEHHVKPLDIIWSKFPRWSSKNTCHVDDLRRNFALNPTSGIYIRPYYRKKSAKKDADLLGLAQYLVLLATAKVSFDEVNFDDWQRVVAGDAPLLPKKMDDN